MAVYDDLIKVRRGTAAQWASKNPILAAGEIGVELGALNDQKFKIGNGTNHWLDLPYFQNAVQIADIIADLNAEGVPGPAGDSAYEVAVNNGFVGSEAAWLASLEGPEGPPGADGADGGSNANFPFAEHYGFAAAVGDPMVFTTNGTLGPNTLFISRLYVPAGVALTSLWLLVNTAGSHDGTSVENKLGLWDDSGTLIGQTPDDPTIFTGGINWRGAAMIGGPIAAQSSPRFAYIGVLVHGMSGLNVAYRVAGDTSGVQIGPATTKRRQILNGSPPAGLPGSFDPTSYSSVTGYCPMMAIT